MKAQLQSHSFSSHEPNPLFHWDFGPFTTMLSSLPSWAFIRMYYKDFQPFVSNMGLQYIHHLWAFLISFHYHYLF